MAISVDTSNTTGTTAVTANPATVTITPGPTSSILILNIVQNSASARTGTFYTFTVTSANATVGDTYTNNGQTFTVAYTISASTTLVCSATGAPTASGTLTRATGTGDTTITFSAATATTTTPTVNGQIMTSASARTGGTGGSAIGAETWYYLSPAVGTVNNIVVPNANATPCSLQLVSVSSDGTQKAFFDVAAAGTGNSANLTASATPTSNYTLLLGFGCVLSVGTLTASGTGRTLVGTSHATGALTYAVESYNNTAVAATAMAMIASVTGRWVVKNIVISEASLNFQSLMGCGS